MHAEMPITVTQMRQLDRIAIEEIGIPGVVLMENAGRAVADEAADLVGDGGTVLVLAGGGNNGGDGYVAARHLDNRGFDVTVCMLVPHAKITGDAAVNVTILDRMGVRIRDVHEAGRLRSALTSLGRNDLIVDAMLGTGLAGPLREPFGMAINRVNECSAGAGVAVLAVDVPSGLDADTGWPTDREAVRARATVSFQFPKVGLLTEQAAGYVGDLKVVDISIPVGLMGRVV